MSAEAEKKFGNSQPTKLSPEEIEKLSPKEQAQYYAAREAYLEERTSDSATRPTMPGLLKRLGINNVNVDPDAE